jgi:hypothetical protein
MSPIEAGGAPHYLGAWLARHVTGPSAEVVVTGNSNPDFGLFGGIAKGVK